MKYVFPSFAIVIHTIAIVYSLSALQAQDIKPVAASVPEAVKAWNGVWKPESCEFNGKQELNGDAKEKIRLSIVGDQYRLFYITDPKEMMGKRLSTATLTLDDKAKTFELDIKEGVRKPEKIHGIFEVKANQLRLCYGPASKPRPTEFKSPTGSDVFYEIWSLEKR